MSATSDNSSPTATVSFVHMADGTQADYELLAEYEHAYTQALPDRILDALRKLESSFGGYQVSRLEHSLQSASRAYRDGRSEAYVVAALLHDMGDDLAPYSHSEMAAAVLRPFVTDKLYWIIKTHGVFQMYYYAHHVGGDRDARECYRDNPWFDEAVEFCEMYDQNCFDPAYTSHPLSFFEPIVRRVFSQNPDFEQA